MNPFDLAGPQFLVFFLVYSAVILLVVWELGQNSQHTTLPSPRLSDPYRIAYLRGGREEAARVATLVLIDRGLLRVEGSKLKKPKKVDIRLADTALERWLLDLFATPAEATSIFSAAGLDSATAAYETELTQLALLPDAEQKQIRAWHFWVAALFLSSVAANKIFVALERGRSNIVFLVALCAIAITLAWKLTHRFRTARGDALLQDLRTLFAALKERRATVQPGGATLELALLAAVFGLSGLPRPEFSYVKELYPKAANSSGSSCGGIGCGSSCGGGCGGGCGGCGG